MLPDLQSSIVQLISGSEGGDVKVWDTAGMDIIPVATLSAHGHITGIGIIATTSSKSAQQQSAQNRARHHAVAATADGDLITWLLELDTDSRHSTVLGVGMLSVADRAVQQLEMIRGCGTPGWFHGYKILPLQC